MGLTGSSWASSQIQKFGFMIHFMSNDRDLSRVEPVDLPTLYAHVTRTPAALVRLIEDGIQKAYGPVSLSHEDTFILQSVRISHDLPGSVSCSWNYQYSQTSYSVSRRDTCLTGPKEVSRDLLPVLLAQSQEVLPRMSPTFDSSNESYVYLLRISEHWRED